MQLPNNFQTQQAAIASYDYSDIANGQGVIEFDLFTSRDETTLSYHTQETGNNYSETLQSNGDDTQVYNFDSPTFNIPRVLKGTASFVFSWFVIQGGGNPTSGTQGNVSVGVYHYDGTTETSLGEATTITMTIPDGNNERGGRTSVLNFDITEKVFKRGDRIRIKVTTTKVVEGGTIETIGICHDPRNSNVEFSFNSVDYTITVGQDFPGETTPTNTSVIQTTRFIAKIPFRIEAQTN